MAEALTFDEFSPPAEDQGGSEVIQPNVQYAAEHPILRTIGRAGRDVATNAAGLVDLGLLPIKTAALGAGIATGSEILKKVGMTPSMHDTVQSGIDRATGGVLEPIGDIDRAGDFAASLIVPAGAYGKMAETAGQASKAPGVVDAVKSAVNPMGIATESAMKKYPVPNRVGPPPSKIPPRTPEQERRASSAIYKDINKSSGAIVPDAVHKWLDEVAVLGPQTDKEAMLAGENKATELIHKLTHPGTVEKPNIFRNSPLTPEEVIGIDKALGDQITFHPNGKMTAEGKQIYDIKNSFLDMIDNATKDPAMVTGGAEGFQNIQRAKDSWARALGLQEVQRIIDNGLRAEQPATAIKNGFKTLLNNPRRMRSFQNNPQIVTAIKHAAKTGALTTILKPLGSRLNAVGGGVGGAVIGSGGGVPGIIAGNVVGNVAGSVIAAPARAAATKLQLNRANAVMDAIRNKNVMPDIGIAPSAVQQGVRQSVVNAGVGMLNQPQQPEPPAIIFARDAIARGAPRDQVIQRLQAIGVDPGGL